jgi:protein-L-isoaspartate(D-aspartate) O-methyltransferase
MVESQLRPQGVTDPGVLAAMGKIAREKFLPNHTRPLAYADRAVAMSDGRFLPAPAVLGQLLTQMRPEPGHRALVVGAGTGYSTAVLSTMGLRVTAIESDAELLQSTGPGVTVTQGELEAGAPSEGPFDQILIDGAVGFIPEALVAQLADGGRLGTALIDRGVTRLIIGRKAGEAFGFLSIGDAGVPALPGFSRPPAFSF